LDLLRSWRVHGSGVIVTGPGSPRVPGAGCGEPLVADEGTTPFPADVLAGLRRVVRCEAVSFMEWSPQELLEFSLAADDPASILPVWDAYPQVRNDDPLAGGASRGSPLPHREWLGRALAISDFISDREFRRRGSTPRSASRSG
jgi:hypothetical protein